MARDDQRFETRNARKKIPLYDDIRWREVRRGVAIGYRRTTRDGAGVWWLRRYANGKYRKDRLGVADDFDPADGQSVLTWDDALRLSVNPAEAQARSTGNYTVGQAVERYLRNLEATSRSPASIRNAGYYLRGRVLPTHGDTALVDLTTEDLQEWLGSLVPRNATREAKRAAQATAERYWNNYHAALELAFREGKIASNAAWQRVVSFKNVDQPGMRNLSEAEARDVLKHARDDVRDLLAAYLLTGARVSELLTLTVDRVEGARILVRSSDAKSGRARSLMLNEYAAALFSRLTDGKAPTAHVFTLNGGSAVQPRVLQRRLAEACAAAGVPSATPRDLRRSFGSLLINRDVRLEIVSALLGHADLRITQRHYAHLLNPTVAEGLAKLPRL